MPLLRRRRPWQGNASWGRSRPLRASAVVFDADDYLWTEDDDDDDYSLSTDVLEPLNSVNTDRVMVASATSQATTLQCLVFCCCCASTINCKLRRCLCPLWL